MNKMNEKKFYHKIIMSLNCLFAFFIFINFAYLCSHLNHIIIFTSQ